MSLINESQLKSYRNTTRTFSISINESLLKFKSEEKTSRKKIFLSHKHSELEILDAAINFLKKEGIDVYVDWLDEDMPKATSGVTAERIKEKIKSNDKFILLASEAAISSKWCNWELGLGDAAKYLDHIALLPVAKDTANYSGTEYLLIYPYIEFRDGDSKYTSGASIQIGFYVRYPVSDGNYHIVPLKEWILK